MVLEVDGPSVLAPEPDGTLCCSRCSGILPGVEGYYNWDDCQCPENVPEPNRKAFCLVCDGLLPGVEGYDTWTTCDCTSPEIKMEIEASDPHYWASLAKSFGEPMDWEPVETELEDGSVVLQDMYGVAMRHYEWGVAAKSFMTVYWSGRRSGYSVRKALDFADRTNGWKSHLLNAWNGISR